MTVIYQEAHKLGIKDVAFEKPSNDPKLHADLGMPISRLKLRGHSVLNHLSSYHDDTKHMIDGRHLEALKGINATMARRNETMAANLSDIDRPSFALVGALHLEGLERRMSLHATHEVVSFDVSQSTLPASRIDHVIKLDRDASRLNDDTLLSMGMGQREGSAFIAWAEANGRKLSNASRNERLHHPVSAKSTDPIAIERGLDALYDAGRFPEAAAAMGQLMNVCGEIQKPSMPSRIACATTTMAFMYRREDVGDELFHTPKLPSISNTVVLKGGTVKQAAIVLKEAKDTATVAKPSEKAWYSGMGEAITNIADDLSQYLPDFLKSKPQSTAPKR